MWWSWRVGGKEGPGQFEMELLGMKRMAVWGVGSEAVFGVQSLNLAEGGPKICHCRVDRLT